MWISLQWFPKIALYSLPSGVYVCVLCSSILQSQFACHILIFCNLTSNNDLTHLILLTILCLLILKNHFSVPLSCVFTAFTHSLPTLDLSGVSIFLQFKKYSPHIKVLFSFSSYHICYKDLFQDVIYATLHKIFYIFI